MNNWIVQLNSIPLWKKYSQCHEEAYLEFMLSHIPEKFKNKFLVDLGAGDSVTSNNRTYFVSNTKHFLENGYFGILIDSNNSGNPEIKEHLITKDNIVALLNQYGCPDHFELLSIDLDGNDIYILDELLKKYKPALIVAEFNPIHEAGKSVAIKYDENHTWGKDDYYGFSFAAGVKLAQANGYHVIFQNNNLNMYIMREDVLIESLQLQDGESLDLDLHYETANGHKVSEKQTWVEY